jgi:hypothetical protein
LRYRPLTVGSEASFPAGATEVASRDPTNELPTYRVQYRDGQTTTYGYTIWNTGRWGVTVTSVDPGGPEAGMLDAFEFQIRRPGRNEALRAFKPFSLEGGEEMFVLVTARFLNCERYVVGSNTSYASASVRYRILGFTRTADIPLGYTVQVPSPPDASCPRAREG